MRPPYMTATTIGERQDLGEIGGHEENSLSRSPCTAKLCMDELSIAPHIHAARRLCREQHTKIASHFARNDDLLLIPPG